MYSIAANAILKILRHREGKFTRMKTASKDRFKGRSNPGARLIAPNAATHLTAVRIADRDKAGDLKEEADKNNYKD